MSPCFLAIEGQMGEGKTVQTIYTCFKHGIHPYYFSSAQLSGNLERDSIKELEATYNYLLEHDREDNFSVIIIDDFHLSIASCDENVSKTVNSQILTDYLMSIADTTKATPGKKIPFILIANTFEHLYSPLTRDGRMKLFKWEPSNMQKRNLIYQMYRDILVEGSFDEFEEFVEEHLVQPTFVMDHPIEISPLTKKKPENPEYVERFEFFMNGWEMANAYSELNDRIDQRERFAAQEEQFAQGDEEANHTDEDFLNALMIGMPPTGGIGFGIDRMCMLMTDSAAIRDVLLFPTMKSIDK